MIASNSVGSKRFGNRIHSPSRQTVRAKELFLGYDAGAQILFNVWQDFMFPIGDSMRAALGDERQSTHN